MNTASSAIKSAKSQTKRKVRKVVPTFETPEARKEPGNIAKAAVSQISPGKKSDKPSPVVEAMMQKTGKSAGEFTQEELQKAHKDYATKRRRLQQIEDEIKMHREKRLQKQQERIQAEDEQKEMKKKSDKKATFVAPKGAKKKGAVAPGTKGQKKNPELQKKKG